MFQVGLISSEQSQVPYCGGTLLSDREVLTAAHCGASVAWVLLGEHSLAAADGEIRARVCSTQRHPGYSGQTQQHDLAILRLCEAVTFTEHVAPACLPAPSTNYDSVAVTLVATLITIVSLCPLASVQAVVSGWGPLSSGGSQASSLQEVTVTTMTNTQVRSQRSCVVCK